MQIDQLSTNPLFIEIAFNETILGTGTGFIVEKDDQKYLITNWHIVSGRNPSTNSILDKTNLAIPNKLYVWHHIKGNLGAWSRNCHNLLDKEGSPLWLEHPKGKEIDVVALKIILEKEKFDVYPLGLNLIDADLIVSPSEPISVIGFPFGQTQAGALPIWKTGHLASDFDINYNEKPSFLIDVTTKSGMSGSPVIAKRIGQYKSSKGTVLGREIIKFLGIYSGRIPDNKEEKDYNIGIVWKSNVINEILKNSDTHTKK